MTGAMSIGHWLIVFVVILLFFGPKKLGNIGQSLGEGIRGLRDGLNAAKAPPALPPATKSEDQDTSRS